VAKKKARRKARRKAPRRAAKRRTNRAPRRTGWLARPEVKFAGAAVAGAAVASMLAEVPAVSELGETVPGGAPIVAAGALALLSMAVRGPNRRLIQAAAVGALGTSIVRLATTAAAEVPQMTTSARVSVPRLAPPPASTAVNSFLNGSAYVDTAFA
jgi:hypothetical protein